MKIRPLLDYIVVSRKAELHQSAVGILIPDTVTEKPMQDDIVAVGNGKILESVNIIPLVLKLGVQVLFGKFSGSEIHINNEDLLIMHESDVFAVVNNE